MRDIYDLLNREVIDKTKIKNILSHMNVVDIADVFNNIERGKSLQIFRLLPKDKAADVFAYISVEKQQMLIEAITDQEVNLIMRDQYADDAVDLLEEVPANVVKKVLRNISSSDRKIINQLLKYPEDSAGSIMTVEYVHIRKNLTIKQAIAHIRNNMADKETFETCYVTNDKRIIEGTISIRNILSSKDDEIIENLMDRNIIHVYTTDDKELVAKVFIKYDCSSIAVVDKEKRLVGIITVDDVVDIIQEENTEDFEIMAGMTPSEKPYLKTNVFKLAFNRIPWLLFLMLSATLTGFVISKFEQQLATQSVLIAFIPMLMDTGGNSGSQSATLAIRGLALNQITTSDFLVIALKESLIGSIAGFALAILNFLRMLLLGYKITVALTVCTSILLTVIVANIIGGILPLAAKSLKLDPALMSAPLITTIVDTISLLTYFFIASLILGL
jgi:magnesium transporter